jgi:hypothetical protein
MTLTDQQRQEFQAAAEPLVKWLNENCHPHVAVVVTPASAELTEGICSVVIGQFIED